MRMAIPKVINYTDIVSLNLPDSTTDAEYNYTGATTYSVGDIKKVSYDSDGSTYRVPFKRYKALKETSSYPPDNASGTDADWEDLGGINMHGMFDFSRSSQAAADGSESTDAGKIVIEIDTSRQDIVGLFNLDCTKVTMELKNPDGDVINTTVYDLSRIVNDWEEYFFKEFDYNSNHLIHTFPRLLLSTLKITIEHSATSLYPAVGYMRCGKRLYCGVVIGQPGSSLMDLSDLTEEAGIQKYKRGDALKVMNLNVRINTADYSKVQNAISSLNGQPTIFEGMEDLDYESFIILGFPRNLSLTMSNTRKSTFSLEAQEIA